MKYFIQAIDPANRDQVSQFLSLPSQLYKQTEPWVPPLDFEVKKILDRKKNPFFQIGEAIFLLALQEDGVPVGRVAILNNHNFNEYNHSKTGFFYLFESLNNQEIANGLFIEGIRWAKTQGLDKIIGPKGFTPLDGIGLLVEGFQHRPAFGLPYNFPYYSELLEANGFSCTGELVSGYLSYEMKFPEKIHRAAELVKKRRGLQVKEFKSRKELRTIVPKLKDLYNNSLGGTEGNVPLTDEEARTLANQIIWFADPRLIKIVFKEDRPVGFLFAYPDVSAALQRTQGRLFPMGWLDLFLELRRTKWININGAGIVEEYRGLGGTAILFSEMYRSLEKTRYRYADIVQIGTENENMQREMQDLGIDFYKKHRIYERLI